MKTLTIGRNGFALPLDAVTESFAILAVRGAGKSNAAVVMAEQMYAAKLHWVAIDPKGDWWGMRSGRDGKSPGLPITIFGGSHGDLPLESTSGELVADLIVDQCLTCILDLSMFESDAARTRFLLAFGTRLFKSKKPDQEPTHLFFEEAHVYMPQKPFREELRLVHAMSRLLTQGRSRGIGATIISQRSALVNKDVLSQVGSLIAMRTVSPQDRKAVEAWVSYWGENRDIIESLPTLENGEAWIWSPQFLQKNERFRFPRRATYDSGGTPKVGASRRTPATLADIDLGALRERMAETIAKAEADDPKILRRRIADLERQLAATGTGDHSECEDRERALRTHLASVQEVSKRNLDQLWASFQEAKDKIDRIGAICSEDYRARPVEPPTFPEHMIAPSGEAMLPNRVKGSFNPKSAGLPRRTISANDNRSSLPKAERAILTVLAQHPDGRPSKAVAVQAGYRQSGGWRNALGSLRSSGLIEGDKYHLTITEKGLRRLGDYEVLPSGDDLVIWWQARLDKCCREILQALLAAKPRGFSKTGIAEATGYAYSGGFRNALGKLRTLSLINRGEPITLSEEVTR